MITYLYIKLILISPIGIGLIPLLIYNQFIIEYIIAACMLMHMCSLMLGIILLITISDN